MADQNPVDGLFEAALAALERDRDELTKAWLMEAIERSSMDELGRLQLARISQELPELIAEIAARLRLSPQGMPAAPEGWERWRGLLLAMGGEGTDARRLAAGFNSLQSLVTTAVARQAADPEATVILDIVQRMLGVIASIQVEAVEELLSANRQDLEHAASTDPLTGLYNLRYLNEELERLIDVQGRYGVPFAILVFDIDGLKAINDAYGHPVGDRVLVAIADALRRTTRTVDSAVRMGGDEFCVLIPHQTAARAKLLAHRISAAIESLPGPDGLRLSVSIGVVSCPEHGRERAVLLDLADRAMYTAKASEDSVAIATTDQPGDGHAW
jgi:diguanylate cyclase (GGDEF)-like protein